ncbi:hypothetical protein [Metaclostridioides mangenotii]|uniref:hypothetical protein n=1 Tax=Metaclostridioides mangenotii TaxID=1540 RepID=UPI000B1CD8F3|nr:hypothetical protein [Clostridioides mangenotii]
MVFGVPQIIMIVLYVLVIGISLADHGKERTGKQNFFSTTIGTSIQIALMYWGGFFS